MYFEFFGQFSVSNIVYISNLQTRMLVSLELWQYIETLFFCYEICLFRERQMTAHEYYDRYVVRNS